MCEWLGVTEMTGITRWEHVHLWKPDHQSRLAARRGALSQGNPLLAALAAQERDLNDGDRDGEPVRFP